ncbi:MAG: hypothetical protein GF370_01740 [Candidatus Nealsonbacteria bacterium]|nr:hypothetical protein [Candidatus Nealsonbacteria bacterium]
MRRIFGRKKEEEKMPLSEGAEKIKKEIDKRDLGLLKPEQRKTLSELQYKSLEKLREWEESDEADEFWDSVDGDLREGVEKHIKELKRIKEREAEKKQAEETPTEVIFKKDGTPYLKRKEAEKD